ncbi:hypothetical protein ACIL7W_25755, partial [Escherichia coli]|uniref:hypothetical protein n=1 Tax=Escherichia coli TaxID=562 RepID=UPI0039BCB8B4
GGQWIKAGGTGRNTTVTANGRQIVQAGGTASDTVIRDGGGQSLNGLAGTTTLNNGATLILSGKTVNNDTLTIREGDALLQGGALTGNGRVEKSGSGTLTVSNT